MDPRRARLARIAALDLMSLVILAAVLAGSFTGMVPWWSFGALGSGAMTVAAVVYATRGRGRHVTARVYELWPQQEELRRVEGL